jgi:predicted Fe-Mo cluster-binding NifX family protein
VTTRKVLVTLLENDVAPRFDLATEVFVSTVTDGPTPADGRTLVLAHRSAEDLCQLILDESVDVVICGGIEEEFYDYLVWKQVLVVDSVSGPWDRVLGAFREGTLRPGAILHSRSGGKDNDSGEPG